MLILEDADAPGGGIPLAVSVGPLTFYHPRDEDAFFGWLGSMDVVFSYEGDGDCLAIRFSRKPNDNELLELFALCLRFNLGSTDLRVLLSEAREGSLIDQ